MTPLTRQRASNGCDMVIPVLTDARKLDAEAVAATATSRSKVYFMVSDHFELRIQSLCFGCLYVCYLDHVQAGEWRGQVKEVRIYIISCC